MLHCEYQVKEKERESERETYRESRRRKSERARKSAKERYREISAIALCCVHHSCILTSAAPGAYDVRMTIVEYALTAELSLHVECFLSAALRIAGSCLDNSLTADIFDDIIWRVHSIYGVGGATGDVIFPVVQSPLTTYLFHVIVRPAVATGRIWNCNSCCCQIWTLYDNQICLSKNKVHGF